MQEDRTDLVHRMLREIFYKDYQLKKTQLTEQNKGQ